MEQCPKRDKKLSAHENIFYIAEKVFSCGTVLIFRQSLHIGQDLRLAEHDILNRSRYQQRRCEAKVQPCAVKSCKSRQYVYMLGKIINNSHRKHCTQHHSHKRRFRRSFGWAYKADIQKWQRHEKGCQRHTEIPDRSFHKLPQNTKIPEQPQRPLGDEITRGTTPIRRNT